MTDRGTALLWRVIWRRRERFFNEAVARGIVTATQAEELHLLHLELDDAQVRREGDG